MDINKFKDRPEYQKALDLVKGKSENEIREIAKKICQDKGIDYNTISRLFNIR